MRDFLFANKDFTSFTLNGVERTLSNINYHCLFLFYNTHRHYMGTGIGIRQICNMAMCINTNHQTFDTPYIKSVITETGVPQLMGYVPQVSYTLLGLHGATKFRSRSKNAN